jgi:hypothetical protein
MDVLLAQQRAVEAHSKYIRSSYQFLDPRIRTALESELADGRWLSPPWLQVEPSREPAGTVTAWTAQGLLHPALDALFQGRPLHRHELDTLQRTATGQDVACATACRTGGVRPGLAAVLNALLNAAGTSGPRALIVCPPGESLRAHADALHRCVRNHAAVAGLSFPVSFACLESGTCVEKAEAPRLLLTTAAMLERLLLGLAGRGLRDQLLAHLQGLLVADLHAWRGRAGADAALLLRRLLAQCANRPTCIATGVPWAADEHAGDVGAAIADAASTLLGRPFSAAQVVQEAFIRIATTPDKQPADGRALHAAIAAGIPGDGRLDALLAHPLARWLEQRVALRRTGHGLAQGRPRPWMDVVRHLAAQAHVAAGTATQALRALLRWIERINQASQSDPAHEPVLPFRLYQPLLQPGPVHATLDQDDSLAATLQPDTAAGDGRRPLFPLAFSRAGGQVFYGVSRIGDRLLPRAFDVAGAGEDGYLIAGTAPDFWPDTRLQRDRTGLSVCLPRRIHFDADGRCSDDVPLRWQGWFLRAPLRLDPATAEANKFFVRPAPAPLAGQAEPGALVLFHCDAVAAAESLPGASPVPAPRMDLHDPRLWQAHLRSLALSQLSWPGRDQPGTMTDLVDETQRALPLRAGVRAVLQMEADLRERLPVGLQRALHDLPLAAQAFRPADTLDALAEDLDRALQPWRALVHTARADLERATQALEGGLLRRDSAAFRHHLRRRDLARRQGALLHNETPGGLDAFHLLAEQGFIPAHHLVRQPLRLFMPTPDGQGDFIARPRAEALRAFAPLQRMRHLGRDYRVRRALLPDAAAALTHAKLALPSGGWLAGEWTHAELCPLTGIPLAENACERLGDLLEMGDGLAEEVTASALEAVPAAQGVDIETCLGMEGRADPAHDRHAVLSADGEPLWNVRYLPAARIVQLARRWHGLPDEGFPLDLHGGEWLAAMAPPQAPRRGGLRRVRLWTAYRADALLLTPVPPLAPGRDGMAVLRRHLPRAAERHFKLHPGELDAALLGEGEAPGLLLVEAGEGGLGVLRGLLESPRALPAVLALARALCRNDGPAPLCTVLDRLAAGTLAAPAPGVGGDDYDTRYARLLRQLAPEAGAARHFLHHLHAHGLRLPDAARRRVDGLYLQADFYFEPRCWVFCDGALAAREDEAGREALLERGDEVWAWHATEDLSLRLAQRPDLFGRAR